MKFGKKLFQAKLLSRLSQKVCRLLSSPVLLRKFTTNRSQRTSKCGKNNSDTLACGSCATSLFLRHFDAICDLLLNRRTATWNLFVKLITIITTITKLIKNVNENVNINAINVDVDVNVKVNLNDNDADTINILIM